MCQNNNITPDKNEKVKKEKNHITYEDRIKMEVLYNRQPKTKKNFSAIARELGFSRSAISREIRRGLYEKLNSDLSKTMAYSSDIGQDINEAKGALKGPNLKIGSNLELAEYIEEKIKEKYSPEVIAYWIKNDKTFETKICAKTIYNYIYTGVLLINESDMIHGKNRRKKKREKEAIRTKIRKEGRRLIDRPKIVENRETENHWEMDLVQGLKKKGEPYLLVLSERTSRMEIIEIIPDKTAESVIKALNRIERRMGVVKFREVFKTITTDNGSEFKDYKGIERSFTNSTIARTKQYYCDAYCSWQRGTNENINRMIRRFLPKGTSFKKITKKMIKRIQKFINNYPRKIFRFKTSKETYYQITKENLKIA